MDGNGVLFGILSGNICDIVYKFLVDFFKKYGCGGQFVLCFVCFREEKCYNYVCKVVELVVQNFIINDKVNVMGIVFVGFVDFKNDFNVFDMFDQCFVIKVIKVVDVFYGGENGFNQVIELVFEIFGNVKFIQEKKFIGKYFEEISQDIGCICYGVEDIFKVLEFGVVEILIVFENFEVICWVFKDSNGVEIIIYFIKQQDVVNWDWFMDKEIGQEMEVVFQEFFFEWIVEYYKDFGIILEFVLDRLIEGNQFVKGFGGIGGIFWYKVNFEQLNEVDDDDEYYDD